LNINSASNQAYGIDIDAGATSMNSNIIQSNTGKINASKKAYGIDWTNSGASMSSNIIQSNTWNINSGLTAYGILNSGSSNSSIIYNETINLTSTASVAGFRAYGIQLDTANSWNFSLLTIDTSTPNAWATDIYFGSGVNNNIFSNSRLLGTNYSVKAANNWGVNNTFTNVSYSGGEAVGTGTSELIRKWYYQAYVNDTGGLNISEANVTAYNVTSDYQFNLTTNATGWTQRQKIIEYINTGGTTKYYSNYTIYASNTSDSVNKLYNVTSEQNNLAHVLTLDLVAPVITLITPADAVSSTTSAYNFTFNVSDSNNVDNCSLIIDGSSVGNLSNVIKNAEQGIYSSGLSVSVHTWSVNCTDNLGNAGNSISRTLTVSSAPSAGAAPSTGGGGGGGAGAAIRRPVSGLSVGPKDISLDLGIGEKKERTITVTNTGDTGRTVTLKEEGLEAGVSFDTNTFTLAPGESTDVYAEFTAPDETGIYTGKILVGGRTVYVSLNVRSKELLFDAMIVVPDIDKEVIPGEKLGAQVTLIPMGEKPRVDVTLNYFIKDFEGKTYSTESETILVEDQVSFKKEFYTENLPGGSYIIGLELVYPGGVATSSSYFEVRAGPYIDLIALLLIVVVGIIMLIILLLILIVRYKKQRRHIYSRIKSKRGRK